MLPHVVGKLISRTFQRTQGFRVFRGFLTSKPPVNEIAYPENERLCSFEFTRAIHARQFCDVADIQYVGFTTIFFRWIMTDVSSWTRSQSNKNNKESIIIFVASR